MILDGSGLQRYRLLELLDRLVHATHFGQHRAKLIVSIGELGSAVNGFAKVRVALLRLPGLEEYGAQIRFRPGIGRS